jgi:hypothetical protein
MLSIDCSYGTCRNEATHRAQITIQGGRAAGEDVVLWVCPEHSKEAAAVRKAGFMQRIKVGRSA